MKGRNGKAGGFPLRGGIVAVGTLLVLLGGCTSNETGSARQRESGGWRNLVFWNPTSRMRLADAGSPLVDIVIASNANENVRFAASELKEHLDKITGGRFTIASAPVIGRRSLRIASVPCLAKQEVRISFSDSGVELESGAYPEYAVWDFLWNYCGVRWLDPTDAGTIIPSNPNLAVVCRDFESRPFAKGRNPGNMFSGRIFNTAYFPELWDRNSPGWTNYLHVAYPSAFTKGSFVVAEREISRRKNLFLRRMKAGGEIASANHSFYWWYNRFWDKSHPGFERFRPELFAKGYEGKKEPPQLCYSNPEVIKQTVADIRAYFDEGGYKSRYRNIPRPGYKWGRDAYCVEPMDNRSFCKCEKCACQYRPELTRVNAQHSDYWFRFVNAVAREIAKSHSGKKISTLAYGSRFGVPSFRLEPNVIVHFCFTCNRRPYARKNEIGVRQLRDWRAAYPRQPFGLWLYNTFPKEYANRVTHVNCFPGFFAHVLRDEYALLADLDVSENIFNCGFVDDYENYLSLRWMWNPRESLKTLEDDYFSSYGKAAPAVKRFYSIVEERYCNPANYPPDFTAQSFHQTAHIAWNVLGTSDVMCDLEALMAEAERLADTPLAKARVANWRAGIFDYMRTGAAQARKKFGSRKNHEI